MPAEPSAAWWPIAIIAGGIVAVGAAWFTRWVIDRLDKDRHNIHEVRNEMTRLQAEAHFVRKAFDRILDHLLGTRKREDDDQ